MKRIMYGLLLIILLCHGTSWALLSSTEGKPITIQSAVLGEQRQLVIYLPEGYQNSQESYPVLYLTDGETHGAHTAGTLDYFAKFNLAPQMIMVGIVTPRETRERDLTLTGKDQQNTTQAANAELFLTFIEKELMPWVKQRYRTLDYQALSGTSHGGQFAIHALIKRPGLFDGIIAISPSLWWNDQQLLALSATALQRQQLQGRLYVSIANEVPIMTEPFQQFVNLTQRYPSDKLVVAHQTFSNETHNTTVLQGQYYGIKHLFSDWAIPENVPQTLADLQSNYEKRSKLLKKTIQIPEDRANGYGQWLVSLQRQEDALALLKWNRDNYPQSVHAHTALIKAYLHFKLEHQAKVALADAFKTIHHLHSAQQAELKSLLP